MTAKDSNATTNDKSSPKSTVDLFAPPRIPPNEPLLIDVNLDEERPDDLTTNSGTSNELNVRGEKTSPAISLPCGTTQILVDYSDSKKRRFSAGEQGILVVLNFCLIVISILSNATRSFLLFVTRKVMCV